MAIFMERMIYYVVVPRTPNSIYLLGAAGGIGGLWIFSYLIDDMPFGLGGFVAYVVFIMAFTLLLNTIRLAIIQKRKSKELRNEPADE
jgi:hypothetical protein